MRDAEVWSVEERAGARRRRYAWAEELDWRKGVDLLHMSCVRVIRSFRLFTDLFVYLLGWLSSRGEEI